MFLTEKPADGVVIGGRFYPVYTDFKNWLVICGLLEEKEGATEEKLCRIFSLCYRQMPESFSEAISGVFQFLSPHKNEGKTKGSMDREKIFSFNQDGELIYAAFLSQYGIDLLEENLHWHKFLALFSGLKGEHKLFDVIFYRTVNLSDITDANRRSYFAKMKKMVALENGMTELEKDIAAAKGMEGMF